MAYATISIIFASAFLAILILLHFLKREIDPSWRMISEYEIGRYGWMMRLAFFCWGGSLLALLVALWPSLRPVTGTISRWWIILLVVALFGAGIFKTDPITEITHSLVNALHTLCGAIVIITFPIAATLAVNCLVRESAWHAFQGWLILATVLAWLGLVVYFGFIIHVRAKDPTAGTPGGPIVYQGWPNRFMVLTYLLWILIVAGIASNL